ncbi:hypothetical protein HX747_30785 [Streptomyces sp. L06]|nr:hypothetical protein [Streptomyces sp. L06]
MVDTQPKPSQTIAWKRNGGARRADVSTQYIFEAAELLRELGTPHASLLAENLIGNIAHVCNWSSPRSARWGRGPAWGPCGVKVELPHQQCREHAGWPLAEGEPDPTPNRCTATLDSELDDSRWRQESHGYRCPFEVRPDSNRCMHHDPKPGELCPGGYDEEPCTEPNVMFLCLKHKQPNHARALEELHLYARSSLCPKCWVEEDIDCRTPRGNFAAIHAARVKVAVRTPEGAALQKRVSHYSDSWPCPRGQL